MKSTSSRRLTRAYTAKGGDDLRKQVDETWNTMYNKKSRGKKRKAEPEPVQQSLHSPKKSHVEESKEQKAAEQEEYPVTSNTFYPWLVSGKSPFMFEGRPLTVTDMPTCMVRFGKCYICHREYDTKTNEYEEKLGYLLSPAGPHPQPIIYYCKDKPYCVESAQASLHADMADVNYVPLPNDHKLAPIPQRDAPQKLWTLRRTSGEIQHDWYVMAIRGMTLSAQVVPSNDNNNNQETSQLSASPYSKPAEDVELGLHMFQGEYLNKTIGFDMFYELNREKLQELLKDVTEEQWIPTFPKYYPENVKNKLIAEFRRCYKLVKA